MGVVIPVVLAVNDENWFLGYLNLENKLTR